MKTTFGLTFTLGLIVIFSIYVFVRATFPYRKEIKEKIINNLHELFFPTDEFTKEREEWRIFYWVYFRWNVNFKQVAIPKKPVTGKWRLIFIPKGMTINLAYKIANQTFPCWKFRDDLNKVVVINVRNADKQHYAVWIYADIEITLLERIILEIKHFIETGEQLLDSNLVCSGSRNAENFELCVSFTIPRSQPSNCHHFLVILSPHRDII